MDNTEGMPHCLGQRAVCEEGIHAAVLEWHHRSHAVCACGVCMHQYCECCVARTALGSEPFARKASNPPSLSGTTWSDEMDPVTKPIKPRAVRAPWQGGVILRGRGDGVSF